MYIVDVIPLILIPRSQPQILSYFHSEEIKKGAMVQVSFGRRTIEAIVIQSDNVESRKTSLRKNATFELKKISKVLNKESLVEDWQFELATHIASYYYAPLGASLKTVLPPFFDKKSYLESKNKKQSSAPQTLILCAENTKVQYFAEKYKSKKPVTLSSNTKNKEYIAIWNSIKNGSTKLIIGTRVSLFLPFSNLKEIIIDDAESDIYKSDMMPRYNGTKLAEFVAQYYKAKISNPNNDSKALQPCSSISVIDMVREIKDANFSIFSRDLKSKLYEVVENKKSLILYIPRRGHANFVFCQTCGKSITCPNCNTSLVVHKSSDTPRLMCHHCDHRQEMPKQCPNCKGYALKNYGVGIEKVVSELKKYFDYQNLQTPPIFQLDSDSTKNDDEKERAIIESYGENPSILVTTQIIFSHEYSIKKVSSIGVINSDTLIKIPDYKSEESLMKQLLRLSKMTDELLIQTYNKDNPVLQAINNGTIDKWVIEEDVTRKQFKYPPYSQLIKLSYKHRYPDKTRNEAQILKEKLKQAMRHIPNNTEYTILGPFPSFISREKGLYNYNILIKSPLPSSLEIIKNRNRLLDYIPAGWIIDIDPKTAI